VRIVKNVLNYFGGKRVLTCRNTASPFSLCPEMYRLGTRRPGAGNSVQGPVVDMLYGYR
jgi:hypothetical protein